MAHLSGCGDRVMEGLVRRIGPLGPAERRRGRPDDSYGSLVRTIVGQQLSTKAARSIYGRLTALFDGRAPSPRELLSTDEELLRSCDLSRPKIRYLRDLARRVISGELDLGALGDLPDEAVIEQIVAVKGLGRWSADMFLMFHLGREGLRASRDTGRGNPRRPRPAVVAAPHASELLPLGVARDRQRRGAAAEIVGAACRIQTRSVARVLGRARRSSLRSGHFGASIALGRFSEGGGGGRAAPAGYTS